MKLGAINSIHSNHRKCQQSFRGNFSYRLQSKLQDEFHITSNQIYIRKYLDCVSKKLNFDEILAQFFPKVSEAGEKEKQELANWLNNLIKNIKALDSSFDEIIPTIIPKTYYRGVISLDGGNRAIDVINNAKKGDKIVPDLGYAFASSSKKYASDCASAISGKPYPDKSAVMAIKTPAGTKVARDLSYCKNPFGYHNIVYQRGVEYEVLDKTIQDGKTFITLKYLGSENKIPV